ncbi:hypothetical protein KR018_011381 [Drosophila ironensis]|nr:hypothetical protein KR018_011381 [Drosophila ironensis]
MKSYGVCCLLLAIIGCLFACSAASPSRHSGPGSGGTIYNPPPPPPPRPFYYDSPIPRPPGQPKTMYA